MLRTISQYIVTCAGTLPLRFCSPNNKTLKERKKNQAIEWLLIIFTRRENKTNPKKTIPLLIFSELIEYFSCSLFRAGLKRTNNILSSILNPDPGPGLDALFSRSLSLLSPMFCTLNPNDGEPPKKPSSEWLIKCLRPSFWCLFHCCGAEKWMSLPLNVLCMGKPRIPSGPRLRVMSVFQQWNTIL